MKPNPFLSSFFPPPLMHCGMRAAHALKRQMASTSGAVSHTAIKGEQKDEIPIQRALLSVSDKTGLVEVRTR